MQRLAYLCVAIHLNMIEVAWFSIVIQNPGCGRTIPFSNCFKKFIIVRDHKFFSPDYDSFDLAKEQQGTLNN